MIPSLPKFVSTPISNAGKGREKYIANWVHASTPLVALLPHPRASIITSVELNSTSVEIDH